MSVAGLSFNKNVKPSGDSKLLSEYNMGVLEFQRLDELFKTADRAALEVLTGNIKAIFTFYGALRLIRVYLISKAKHLTNLINEKDKEAKVYVAKLDRLLKNNKRVPAVERKAIQATLDYYSVLFWVKDILGYGVPFRKVYSDEEQIKRALGFD